MVGFKWRHKVWEIYEKQGKHEDTVVLVTFLGVILMHHYSIHLLIKDILIYSDPSQNPACLIINSMWMSVCSCGDKLKMFSS